MLLLDPVHAGVQIAEKLLHRLLAGGLPVAEALREPDLGFEMQPVGLAPAEMMQVVADLPDEGQGLPEGAELVVGYQSEVFQVPGLAQIVLQPGEPEHRVVVPQPALAFLQVGFQEVGRVPVLGMARAGGADELLEDAAGMAADDPLPQLAHELREEHRGPANKAGIEDRGEHVQVLGGERQALLERACGVAHIQAHVPERVDHLADELLGALRNALAEQKQQIDVGVDALLLAAVAAECDDGVGVLVDLQPGADHAGFKRLLEVVVQRPRMLLQKVGLPAAQKPAGQLSDPFLKRSGCRFMEAQHGAMTVLSEGDSPFIEQGMCQAL